MNNPGEMKYLYIFLRNWNISAIFLALSYTLHSSSANPSPAWQYKRSRAVSNVYVLNVLKYFSEQPCTDVATVLGGMSAIPRVKYAQIQGIEKLPQPLRMFFEKTRYRSPRNTI